MSVRYGIVGCGRMGGGHARKLGRLEDAEVVCVCDLDRQAAERLAQATGAAAYTDYHEMLDRERLDALYLCTPVRGRPEQVEVAAARGLSLYVEKPLAASVEDGERIAQHLEESGVIHTIGFQWRYLDVVDRAREIAGDDPIALVTGHYYWTVPLVGWIRSRHLGGGQMVDQVIHLVDLATYFAGPVAHVFSAFTQQCTVGEMENWDGYSTTAMFENGTVGSFFSTYALYQGIGEAPTLDVIQKNRLLRITPGQLVVKSPGREDVFVTRDEVPAITRAFHNAVATGDGSALRAPARAAFHSLKVVLAATRSARETEMIRMSEFDRFSLSDLEEVGTR